MVEYWVIGAVAGGAVGVLTMGGIMGMALGALAGGAIAYVIMR